MKASMSRAFLGCHALMARVCLAIFGALVCVSVAAVAASARVPTGLWSTPDKGGVVRIDDCGGALCGTIVGLTANPQGVLPRDFRGAPQCHLTLLRDLRPKDDGLWHGTVTNPEDGKVYDAEVWVAPDGNMRLRGYIGVPLLGQTQVWPPFDGSVQDDCHFR